MDTPAFSQGKSVGIGQAIGRMAIGLVLLFGPLILLKLVVLPVLGLRSGRPPLEAMTAVPFEFLVTILSTIAVNMAGYVVYVRWLERRSVDEFSIKWQAKALSLFSGIGLIGAPMLLLYATGYYSLERLGGFRVESLGIVLIVFTIVLLEELVFRGLIMGGLEKASGTRVALVVQAVLFSAAHTFNDHWSGLMPLVSTFLIGLLWGAIFLVHRNIWANTLHHAAWNLTIFSAGLPLSGITEWRAFAPLQSRFEGPEWLTGGLGGPELSVLTPIVVVVALWALSRWQLRAG